MFPSWEWGGQQSLTIMVNNMSDQPIVKPVIKKDAIAKKGAKDSAAVAVHMKKFMKLKEVGEIMDDLDVLHIGRGMYAYSQDKLDVAIKKFMDLLTRLDDPENAVLVGTLLRQLINSYNETATNIIKSQPSERAPTSSGPPIVFPANAKVTATVKVEQNEKPAKVDEEIEA